MADDPQSRHAEALGARPARRLAGARGADRHRAGDVYEAALEAEDTTAAPDGRPPSSSPAGGRTSRSTGRQDQYVARRDFAKFLVLTSGAFVAGQAWIAAQHLVRANRPPPPRATDRRRSTRSRSGSASVFDYPGRARSLPADPARRARRSSRTARCARTCPAPSSRGSTEGVLHCPCHEGYFDLAHGTQHRRSAAAPAAADRARGRRATTSTPSASRRGRSDDAEAPTSARAQRTDGRLRRSSASC